MTVDGKLGCIGTSGDTIGQGLIGVGIRRSDFGDDLGVFGHAYACRSPASVTIHDRCAVDRFDVIDNLNIIDVETFTDAGTRHDELNACIGRHGLRQVKSYTTASRIGLAGKHSVAQRLIGFPGVVGDPNFDAVLTSQLTGIVEDQLCTGRTAQIHSSTNRITNGRSTDTQFTRIDIQVSLQSVPPAGIGFRPTGRPRLRAVVIAVGCGRKCICNCLGSQHSGPVHLGVIPHNERCFDRSCADFEIPISAEHNGAGQIATGLYISPRELRQQSHGSLSGFSFCKVTAIHENIGLVGEGALDGRQLIGIPTGH